MTGGREEIVELGRWIAAERGKRVYRGKPLSTPALSRLFNTYTASQKLPVKQIAQQEISALENVTLDKGPKRMQPWFMVLRSFIENGQLDELLAAIEGPPPGEGESVVVDFWQVKTERETLVRTPDGKVVGSIVWSEKESG